jgi:hypothetical protein
LVKLSLQRTVVGFQRLDWREKANGKGKFSYSLLTGCFLVEMLLPAASVS